MSHSERSLRADAARNRERLIVAAREVFATEGLSASLRQIARHAGVSEPTLRRRFASRQELVMAAFEDKIALQAELAERALATPDPWAGFAEFVETMTRMQLVDLGFREVLSMTFPASMRAEKQRRRAYSAINRMIDRAKNEGGLRADFSPEDMVLVMMAHAGIASAGGVVADDLSRRLVAYLLQAFRGSMAPLPPAPSEAHTYLALIALHEGDPEKAEGHSS